MIRNESTQPKIAIIGAGLAGLTCATALKGFADVQLFEASIFAGGRVSRFQFGDHKLTHDEQYLTVSNPLFLNIIDAWQSNGLIRAYEGWIVELERGQVSNLDDNIVRYVGHPTMQAIADNLASACNLKTSTKITELEHQQDGRWQLFDSRGGYQGLFDVVIVATAAHHAVELSRAVPEIAEAARKIDMTVCWSAMFEFDQPLGLPFDAAFVLDSPLSWISGHQELSEDGNLAREAWIMHCSPEWSLQYAASFRGRVMHALLDAFFEAVDIAPIKPASSNVHCWKHALPINTLDEDCLFDETIGFGACGDWCTAPRIEGAVLSGFSMADRVMKYLTQRMT